jgi:hypothetical protein
MFHVTFVLCLGYHLLLLLLLLQMFHVSVQIQMFCIETCEKHLMNMYNEKLQRKCTKYKKELVLDLCTVYISSHHPSLCCTLE